MCSARWLLREVKEAECRMPKRWSTKNLHVIEPPTDTNSGVGVFEFTDDYSIFHFGKMPDQIEGKGEALCRMAAEHAPDEPLPARRELHELGPLVDRGCAATDQTHPMESVDHSRDAGRADEQPIAEIGQPQRPQTLFLAAVQGAEHAPLRATDPEPCDVRLHDPLQQTEGADQRVAEMDVIVICVPIMKTRLGS